MFKTGQLPQLLKYYMESGAYAKYQAMDLVSYLDDLDNSNNLDHSQTELLKKALHD